MISSHPKEPTLFSTTRSYFDERVKALHRDVHAITAKHLSLSDRQLQGHTEKLSQQHMLPSMVLRPKEMFRTAGTIETWYKGTPGSACTPEHASTHLPCHYACIKVGLPFSGKVDYPTVEADDGFIYTGDTIPGSVQGHTLVYTLSMPIDKFDYSVANSRIQEWVAAVEDAVKLLNNNIDAFNATLPQQAEQLLRTQCQHIAQAIEDMARLPYPIKTL